MELHNASLDDPDWLDRSVRFHREWIDQFTDESALTQCNFHRDLAEALVRSGSTDAGLAVFHETVARWSDNVWSYVALADAYADGPLPVDLEQALDWIAKARARVPADAEGFDVLDEREASIRELIGKAESSHAQRASSDS